MDAYFQDENANSELLGKQFEEAKNEPGLKHDLNKKWGEVLNAHSPEIDLKHILHKILFNIDPTEEKPHMPKTRQLYARLSKIAAILVLPLLALSAFLVLDKSYSPLQFSEIIAPKGEKAQFILPDGSTGYLNSGSTLKYAYPFQKNRTVELRGEGFFDVVKDKMAFTVQVQGMKVEVHGTRFNVCAYDDDPDIVTTLEEGSVSVTSNTSSKEVKISPGQQAVFSKADNKTTTRDVDPDLYVSWKDNMLKLQDAPFADVVKKMERWYDVRIILDNKLRHTQHYTMTIKTESLREMLDLMVVTTPMRYKVEKDIVYITPKSNMPMK